ncbi:carbonic anhydrase, partial [Streptomyces sp. WAC04770]
MKITRAARTAPTTRRTLLRASAATAAAGVLAAGSSPVGAAPRPPAAPLA